MVINRTVVCSDTCQPVMHQDEVCQLTMGARVLMGVIICCPTVTLFANLGFFLICGPMKGPQIR